MAKIIRRGHLPPDDPIYLEPWTVISVPIFKKSEKRPIPVTDGKKEDTVVPGVIPETIEEMFP